MLDEMNESFIDVENLLIQAKTATSAEAKIIFARNIIANLQSFDEYWSETVFDVSE
jgi:hypothetical protein